jgi:hypothetical protein
MRLLRRQPEVAATTGRKATRAEQLSIVLNLGAAGVVNALSVAALKYGGEGGIKPK